MGRVLGIDIETFSDVDLIKCGVYAYADSPAFEVLLFAYSFDGEETQIIDLAQGEPIPEEVETAIFDDSVTKTAFNANFERTCLSRFFGIRLSPDSWHCSAVQAAMLALPRSLEDVGAVLGLDKQKMKEGKELIRYFCVPCKPTKANGGRIRNLPHHSPEKWELFKTYCKRDVDVYQASVMPGRFDYIPADSQAGVVIYEGKFAYSHHATDPVCGKLLNAFDIVRIHKFGEKDGKAAEDANVAKLPSFKAMSEFAVNDEKVKLALARERQEAAQAEFDSPEEWQKGLELDRQGKVKDTLDNLVLAIRHDENLQSIAFNLHRDGIDTGEGLPWKQIKPGWNDSDFVSLKVYLNKGYGVYAPSKTKDALLAVASERAYHPVKEYLDSLPEWDGIKRVDTILTDYLGAEDSGYTRAVIRKTLAAAVARIYQPGTKFDSVLILNGPQGIGKSTLFAKLAGAWFSDSLTLTDMRDKSGPEKLQGYWVLELGELAGMKKTDVETVKSFLSRVDDKYRASYGLNVESHPRQCVIVGSTNTESGFLRDITGNRRFWPVRVDGQSVKKPWQISERDVLQIWAEAKAAYEAGERLFLEGDVAAMATSEQAEAMETDEREGLVRAYLDTLLPENWDSMSLYDRRNFLNGSEFGEA